MNLTAHKQQQELIDEQPGMSGILGDAAKKPESARGKSDCSGAQVPGDELELG